MEPKIHKSKEKSQSGFSFKNNKLNGFKTIKIGFFVMAMLVVGKSWGQTTIFTETMGSGGSNGAAIAAWETNNYFDNDGYTMSGTGDMRNTNVSSGYTDASDTSNVMLNAANEYFQIAGINTTGYSDLTLSFGIRKNTNAETGSTMSVQVSSDSSSWTTLTMPSLPTGQNGWYYRTCTGTIPATSTLYVKFTSSSTTEYRIDDIKLVGTASATPTITLTPTSLSGFTYVAGSGPSTEQTFTVSGSNLTNDISIAAPTNYEISKTSGTGYASSLTFIQSGGTVSAQTVYVRLKAGLAVGSYNGEDISATSEGAASKTVAYSGSVTAEAVAGACATDLIISEYVEGSSNNKYIEIYNGTGASVDLSNYKLQLYANGATSPTNDVTLSGTLTNGSVIVYKNSASSLYAGIDNPAVNFNGDDAIALYKISTSSYVDIFGRIGEDPGTAWSSDSLTTLDKTLRRKATVVAGVTTNPGSGFPTLTTEWDMFNIDIVSDLGSHTMFCGPTITVTPTTLTNFTYINGSGPSAEKSFEISGTNLTANISITPPANYEISTGTGGLFVATNPITLTQSGGNVASTTIYVRLKSGLAVGDYNTENITATSTDAADKIVTCSGTVTAPTLSVPTTALTGLDYFFGNGPSTSQSFTVSGTNLTNDLVVTAPADYEVSTVAGSGYGASVSLTPASNTVATTTIYVRLKSGKAIGTYNLQNIVISSTGATSANLACSGKVTLAPATNLAVGCTGNTTADISWTTPVGTSDGVVITIRRGTNVPQVLPSAPSTLTPNTAFGNDSTQYGNDPDYSYYVYKGNGNSVTITGLTQGETYKIKAFTYYNDTYDNTNAVTTTSINALGLLEVTLANNTDSDAQSALTWNNPIGACFDEVLVVCKQTSSVIATPSGDGSLYTANTVFSLGTDIGTNEYVVYKGTGTNITITGLTNDEVYYAKIFVRKGTEWSTGVELILYPTTVTILEYGDLAIVAVNTGQSGGDEISFVSFKSIATGTAIDFTDNGYERAIAGKWGDTEGTIRITRTGSNVPAGSVITIIGDDGGATPLLGTDFNIYLGGAIDNANWTLSSLNGSSQFNMNSSDQVWIMQGGNWNNPAGDHNATYSGNVLYGWTAIGWFANPNYASTSGSTIYPGCECATTNVFGKTNADKVKYTGLLTAATRTEWIGRINDPSNWTDYSSNALFDAGLPAYRDSGATFTITAGSLTVGKWAGYKSSEWCDCANWYSLKVPDASIDVEIPIVNTPQFELILENDTDCTAECKSLNILGTVSNNEGAILKVYDDFVLNTGSVDFSVNTIDIEIGGDIIIDDASNFLTSKVNLTMNGTVSQTFNVEGATLETIQLNSLKLTSGGTKTIADNLKITTDLSVDNSILNFSTLGSSLTIDGNITLQNGATMHNNNKSNLDIILSSGTSQTLRGSGNAIKARTISADKTDANLILSNTGGTTFLEIGSLGNFSIKGTGVFTDNAATIQTDDDLYLGGDGISNYNLTGTVIFTGANVSDQMLLSNNLGTGMINAELNNLTVKGGNLKIMPATGSSTLVIKKDYRVENTGTVSANGNNLNIGGNYFVNSDASFDASAITVSLNGATNQNLSANGSIETFGTLVVNKSAGNVILQDNIEANALNLTAGLITTGAKRVFVSNTTPANLSNYSTASYINGNLRRAVSSSGSYDMPVGNVTNYELANILLNSSTDLNYLDASFHPIDAGDLDISGLGLIVGVTEVQTLLNGGFWTLRPNIETSAVNYNVGLTLVGSTNIGTTADQHTIVKRDNGGSDWGIYGSHLNSTQTLNGSTIYAYRSNINSFSDFAIAKNDFNSLPVELLNFIANCQNNAVEILWSTASETNSSHFVLEYSLDALNWNYLASTEAAGNSNSLVNYKYTTNQKSASYFRLIQVDFDGQQAIYGPISNNCQNDPSKLLVKVYPNPFHQEINLIVEDVESAFFVIEIIDLNGRILKRKEFSNQAHVVITTEDLSEGVYSLRVITHSKSEVFKLIKQ